MQESLYRERTVGAWFNWKNPKSEIRNPNSHVKLYVGITDYDWFKLHSSKAIVEEVNFWKPSSQLAFKVLQWGEPFLFKLHAPRNFVVGGGFFTKFLRLPVSLAWQTFGEANGARTLDEVRIRIAKYRRQPIGPTEDPVIGCILLEEPFFFAERDWIAFAQKVISVHIRTGSGSDRVHVKSKTR